MGVHLNETNKQTTNTHTHKTKKKKARMTSRVIVLLNDGHITINSSIHNKQQFSCFLMGNFQQNNLNITETSNLRIYSIQTFWCFEFEVKFSS